jgi:vancomycin resistance protein YoaR
MAKTKNKIQNKKSEKKVMTTGFRLTPLLGFFTFVTLSLFALNLYFLKRTYPKISVAGVNMGNLTKPEILERMKVNFPDPSNISIIIGAEETDLSIESVGFNYDFDKSANETISYDKKDNIFLSMINIPQSLFRNKDLPLIFEYDEQKFEEFIKILEAKNVKPSISYSINLQNGKVNIEKGRAGEVAMTDELKIEILRSLSLYEQKKHVLEFRKSDNTLDDQQILELKKRAENLIGKALELSYNNNNLLLKDNALVGFLAKDDGYNNNQIVTYIEKSVLPKVQREPQNATFIYVDKKVEGFTPAKVGIAVNEEELLLNILSAMRTLDTSTSKTERVTIPVFTKEPEITLEDVNNLGINELVGRGTSFFRGSIPTRVFNIGHAAAKFNSILVAPGEEFSFNKILGDVTALTGYKQAYIIKDGRTVLGDGGGVCQVSTTLFRAVLDAGLPIIDRRAHSYRVGYYEQGSPPGIDATVYYPTTDFKFKNDTAHHLLIQSVIDKSNNSLAFEIYGTSDGRKVTISKPVVTNVTAPPEDLYVDDPTLPAGQIKQIDHKAWGAKVTFNYLVVKDGKELTNRTFVSNYRPWQSVFLRGTGPAN